MKNVPSDDDHDDDDDDDDMSSLVNQRAKKAFSI